MEILVLSIVAGIVVLVGMWIATRETKSPSSSSMAPLKGLFGEAKRTVSIDEMNQIIAARGSGISDSAAAALTESKQNELSQK